MSTESITSYVAAIGRSYSDLVAEGVIPADEPEKTDPDSETFFIMVEGGGVELSFSEVSQQLEKVVIRLLSTRPNTVAFAGDLPEPFSRISSEDDVRREFGTPAESKGPVKLPVPLGSVGGWDSYPFAGELRLRLTFQYTPDMRVSHIFFARKQ